MEPLTRFPPFFLFLVDSLSMIVVVVMMVIVEAGLAVREKTGIGARLTINVMGLPMTRILKHIMFGSSP